jgi:hypothetical protein
MMNVARIADGTWFQCIELKVFVTKCSNVRLNTVKNVLEGLQRCRRGGHTSVCPCFSAMCKDARNTCRRSNDLECCFTDILLTGFQRLSKCHFASSVYSRAVFYPRKNHPCFAQRLIESAADFFMSLQSWSTAEMKFSYNTTAHLRRAFLK